MASGRAGETVLITGASAGIGAELAREFAPESARLVLVARRRERLEALAKELTETHGVAVEVVACDLARQGAADELIAELERRDLVVDLLVNNAGFGARGDFATLDRERQLSMIQLNVTTLVALTHALLPGMIERGRGAVLNVASTAAFQPGPYMAVYYATKAFVQSFSEALHQELAGTPVRVTSLCPGATSTEFAGIADLENSLLFRHAAVPPGPVARAGRRAVRAGRATEVVGWLNRLGVFGVRLTPRRWARWFVARIQG